MDARRRRSAFVRMTSTTGVEQALEAQEALEAKYGPRSLVFTEMGTCYQAYARRGDDAHAPPRIRTSRV